MTNPTQHAQRSLEASTAEVRRYMPTVGRRIVLNYFILIGVALVISLSLVPQVARFVPRSTAQAIGFAVNLLWLVNGWRYLEQRNKATGLFVLYTRFSRERRDLEQMLSGEEPTESDTLYVKVDTMEEAAQRFIDVAQEENIQPRDGD